ncbi:MAG: twin-arginine translocation signal domain-containing protein, partial [Raoultibacter sp.]
MTERRTPSRRTNAKRGSNARPAVRRPSANANPLFNPTDFRRSSSAPTDKQPGLHIPTGNGEILITRRHFLYGALGVGALAAAAAGGTAIQNAAKEQN